MTHRESFTLAAVTFLLGAIIGAWAVWKLNFDRDLPLPVTTEIIKWEKAKGEIRDSVRYHDRERTRWHDSTRFVDSTVTAMNDSQARECVDSIPPKELCKAWLTLPLVKKELTEANKIISLDSASDAYSDSLINFYKKDGELCRRDKKKGLNAAKLKGGGIVLGAAAIWQGVKKLFGF